MSDEMQHLTGDASVVDNTDTTDGTTEGEEQQEGGEGEQAVA